MPEGECVYIRQILTDHVITFTYPLRVYIITRFYKNFEFKKGSRDRTK